MYNALLVLIDNLEFLSPNFEFWATDGMILVIGNGILYFGTSGVSIRFHLWSERNLVRQE